MKPSLWIWVRVLVVALSLAAGIGSYVWRQKVEAAKPPVTSADLPASDEDDSTPYPTPVLKESSALALAAPAVGTPTVPPTTGPPTIVAASTAPPKKGNQVNEWEQHITTSPPHVSSSPVSGVVQPTIPPATSPVSPSPSLGVGSPPVVPAPAPASGSISAVPPSATASPDASGTSPSAGATPMPVGTAPTPVGSTTF